MGFWLEVKCTGSTESIYIHVYDRRIDSRVETLSIIGLGQSSNAKGTESNVQILRPFLKGIEFPMSIRAP